MRPIKLTMQAFGSYKEKTTVDFGLLDQNLFLITGDTGAGKTTIFDAIVFALYGEASSGINKKDGTELQSQFADLGTEPFVELQFSEKRGEEEYHYCVRRTPRHIRPHKRGKGQTEEKETVSLLMPDGREYPQKEADAKLVELVGLTKSQFMQVAMIAQGEFMELLRARSDDKKVIFRRLFNTELYQKIVEELGRRRKEKLTEIAEIRTACQTEIAHVAILLESEEAQELGRLRERMLRSERLSVVDLEEMVRRLEQFCQTLLKKKTQVEAAYQEANAAYLAKRDAATKAQQLLERFAELEQAEQELRACEEAQKNIDRTAELLVSLRLAGEVAAVYRQYADANKRAEETARLLEEQKEGLPLLAVHDREAAAGEEKAAAAQEQTNAEFTRVSQRVEKALEILKQVQTAGKEVQAGEKRLKQMAGEAKAAADALTALEAQEQEWRAQYESRRDTEKLLALWKVRAEEEKSLEKELGAAEAQGAEIDELRIEAGKCLQAYQKAREAYESKNGEYERDRAAFLDAQAGLLAREKLRPGQPCPVCGSTEHPNPCLLKKEHRELTREKIEAMAEAVLALQKEQEQKSQEAGSARTLLAEKESRLKQETARLWQRVGEESERSEAAGEFHETSLARLHAALAARRSDLKKEGDRLKKEQKLCDTLKKNLDGAEIQKASLREKAEQARQAASMQEAALAASRATYQALLASRDFQSEEEALQAQNEASAKKKACDRAHNAARKQAQAARTALDNAQLLIKKYTEELPQQREETGIRQAAYEAKLKETALTEARWQELVRTYDRQQLALFEKSIEAHKKKRVAAESKKEQAVRAIGGQKRPDPALLQEETAGAKEVLNRLQDEQERIREAYRVDHRTLQALSERLAQRGCVMAEHGRLDTLYNLLAGKVTGARMDIETFVQRYYLERILHAANRRFREMSAGQFELRMCDLEKAGEGKNRGLDLMVYSAVTGKEREVRTLSGGESFMAALSLALGLADQIQASSASVHLDMMFIDEGFGSLDEHSREQAVRVLQEMAGTKRLIGIISHVTEMKQEIEDQLLVRKDENGSHIQWQIR